jgi:hypothetical protein
MRLLPSGLSSLQQTKPPQRQFLPHRLGLLLLLPGHAPLRHLSRESPDHERTFARGYARDCDGVALHHAALPAGIPPEHAQAFVMDASGVPQSGQQPSGLDRLGNGSQSRTAKGLAISTLAWLALTGHSASCLRVEPTPPRRDTPNPEATRMAGSLEQRNRVGKAPALRLLRSGSTDGASSKHNFGGGRA